MIKLIAFDLDGTFLADDKSIPEINMEALNRAAESGIVIVPSTGRGLEAIPEPIRMLPFIRYCILANGAHVYDRVMKTTVYKDEIRLSRALEILAFLSPYDVKFDAFVDGAAYMGEDNYETLDGYTANEISLKMIRGNRHPVKDLAAYLTARGENVQKVTAHFKDLELRKNIIKEMARRFPDTVVTTSLATNMEVNHLTANKGNALQALCELCQIDMEERAAFGDGNNDIEMLQKAGHGFAMINAPEEIIRTAAYVTEDNNNEGGVGREILRLLERCVE